MHEEEFSLDFLGEDGSEGAGVDGIFAVIAEDKDFVFFYGVGDFNSIERDFGYALDVSLIEFFSVYEEFSIFNIYYVTGDGDDSFDIILTGWHTDGNDIASVIVRDKAEIGCEFTILEGGQHGISVDDGYACYEAKDEQGYHEEDD